MNNTAVPLSLDRAVSALRTLNRSAADELEKSSLPIFPWHLLKNYSRTPDEVLGLIREKLLLKESVIFAGDNGIWLECGEWPIDNKPAYVAFWIRKHQEKDIKTINLFPFFGILKGDRGAMGVPYFQFVLSTSKPETIAHYYGDVLKVETEAWVDLYFAPGVLEAWRAIQAQCKTDAKFTELVRKDSSQLIPPLSHALQFLAYTEENPPVIFPM